MSARLGLLLALMLALGAGAVRAQPPENPLGADDDERVRFTVFWGFDGTSMIAERWAPITIAITSGPRAVSGTIEITYRQDASQTMRLSLPFSTTPGVVVPVEAALALPSGSQGVSVRVLDERGRRLRARTFTNDASRDDEMAPHVLPPSTLPLLAVGVDALASLAPALSGQPTTPARAGRAAAEADEEFWTRLTAFKAIPQALPSAWMAYDGVAAVVIDDDQIEAIPRDAQNALREWVLAGGVIVLIADRPESRWRSLLEPPGAPIPVRLAPTVSVEPTSELADLVEPSPTLSARPITLTSAAAGWSQRWRLPDGASLLAQGPLGAGWVILLGVDPKRLPAVISNDDTATLWRDVLRGTVAARLDETTDTRWYWGGLGYQPSGATPRERAAIASVLDHTLRAPPPSAALFVLIIACVVLLALLLGPFDAIVLKRLNRRQHSWGTALLYIALACVPAALAPVLFRSGKTTHARARCVDTLPPELGALSLQSGLNATFAAAPGPVRFAGAAPGSWWRPVSSLQTWRTSSGAGATLSCLQGARATPRGLVRQTTPDPSRGNTQRLWTLRTTLDRGRAPESPIASIDQGAGRVRVGALPPGARVLSAVLVIRGDTLYSDARRWITLPPADASAGVYEATYDPALGEPAPPAPWAGADVSEEQLWRWNALAQDYAPARLAELPGAWARTRALDAYVASGRYAMLLLEIEHASPDTPIDVPADVGALEVHRLIVPLEGSSP